MVFLQMIPMFKLRANGIYEVQLVKRAVLEQNGQLTIVEYGDESIRYPIIVDGQANMDVLELIKKDEHWLLTQIQEQGFQRLQEIYLGEYLSGQLSLSPYEEKRFLSYTFHSTYIKIKW